MSRRLDVAAPSVGVSHASHALPYPSDRKRRKLRVAIITENFLPKVDGVTRTLARLLEHLNAEGHEALVCGPDTGMSSYANHPVEGTFGFPLIIYPGLKLNFARPRFIRRLQQFKPDVIHFVDPIWLGAQMLPVVQKYLPLVPCVSSYHTNLPTYATLFGMPWLESTMWRLTRNLHDRCEMTFCPSESTRRMLRSKGFERIEIWSRGVDTSVFNPQARDDNLRASWGCLPKPAALTQPLSPSIAEDAALLQLAQKLGVQVRPSSLFRANRKAGSHDGASPDDHSFIRTPPMGPSLTGSPEMSPPPSYDSLRDIPDLPGGAGAFALPPPAVPTQEPPPPPQPASILSAAGGYDSSGSASTAAASVASQPESKAIVLYVGRLSWEKNLRLLIEAFRMLPAAVRAQAKLVFVGDGPARGDLTRLCKKYELDAAFMGHQKGKRLAAMYASASIFAFPSFTETFGQVVLEALASGLPVVGLHAEGTSDLVVHGKTGLLLDVRAAVGGGAGGGDGGGATTSWPSSSSANTATTSAAAASSAPVSPRLTALRRSEVTAQQLSTSANKAAAPSMAMADFASAATDAAQRIRPAFERSASSRSSSLYAAATSTDVGGAAGGADGWTPGLATPLPSIGEFAQIMSPSHAQLGTSSFLACARSYSMLLERLVRDRTLRSSMGQRATLRASNRTWWDAMDAVVRGYETVVERAGIANLGDEELEALRNRQRRKAPLTGPIIKSLVLAFLVLFVAWAYMLLG